MPEPWKWYDGYTASPTPPFRVPGGDVGPAPPVGMPVVPMEAGGEQYSEDFYMPPPQPPRRGRRPARKRRPVP